MRSWTPLVLLLTSALTVLFSWTAARLLGLPLRMGQVAVLTFLALAVGSLLLASVAPVAWLFTICAPAPSPAARTAHNLLYLLHTAFVGGCGLAGTRALWRAMATLGAPRRTVRLAPPLPHRLPPGHHGPLILPEVLSRRLGFTGAVYLRR